MKGNLCPKFNKEVLKFMIKSNILGNSMHEFQINVEPAENVKFFGYEVSWKAELLPEK